MAQGGSQRRLAAIVAIDVAGYSRLMGADEQGTLVTLKGHRAVSARRRRASRGLLTHGWIQGSQQVDSRLQGASLNARWL